MGAVALAVDLGAAAVEAAFLGGDGVERRGPLPQLWNVRFETVKPVRSFPSFPGQRSYQAAWWCATTGAHVGFESWLERDHAMLLDFDRRSWGCTAVWTYLKTAPVPFGEQEAWAWQQAQQILSRRGSDRRRRRRSPARSGVSDGLCKSCGPILR